MPRRKELIMTLLQHSQPRTYATLERLAVDLTFSENPIRTYPKAQEAIIYAAGKAHLYPQEEDALISSIADHHIGKECILLGAGSNQILEDYLKGKELVVPTAAFPESVACMATLKGQAERISLSYKRDGRK
jgi:histidinol-phosphate/aromatic aminotransferase/cobyric acid decarboxylase-like protein